MTVKVTCHVAGFFVDFYGQRTGMRCLANKTRRRISGARADGRPYKIPSLADKFRR